MKQLVERSKTYLIRRKNGDRQMMSPLKRSRFSDALSARVSLCSPQLTAPSFLTLSLSLDDDDKKKNRVDRFFFLCC